MIITSQLPPAVVLSPFVRCYTYREFDTKGSYVVKPKHAVHEIAMHFFFKGLPVKLTDPATGQILKTGKTSGVSGLASHFVGEMTFNGFYSFFEIAFRPHGFATLFDIPVRETLDLILWTEEIFRSDVNELHEQLCEAESLLQMKALADAYLLRCLSKQKTVDYKSRIIAIAGSINRNKGLVNIDQLASYVNMSVRSFERFFQDAIGISPKHFCCITRFNYALELKLRYPELEWTSIAYQAGYFDQMHLIKDFKRFSGDSPSALLKETPLFVEHYTGRIINDLFE